MNNTEFDFCNGIIYKTKPFVAMITKVGQQKVICVYFSGDPNRETQRLMSPLYSTAYAIRKLFKEKGVVFTVDKLRGRWPDSNCGKVKSQWTGKYALAVPKSVEVIPEISPKKTLDGVNIVLEDWDYGIIGQILHVGSYDTEHETIHKLYEHVRINGFEIIPDSHEEIYLSDPNKTPPEKMKTLVICRLREC